MHTFIYYYSCCPFPGIRPVDFLGNFYMSNTTDIELAAIDSEKSVSIEIKHDDKLNEADGAYVQAAVLYTSITGQRRLRIINMAFNVCTQLADLFRNCELDVFINHLAKMGKFQSLYCCVDFVDLQYFAFMNVNLHLVVYRVFSCK